MAHHAATWIVGQNSREAFSRLRRPIGHDHLPGMDGVADADAATVMDGEPAGPEPGKTALDRVYCF